MKSRLMVILTVAAVFAVLVMFVGDPAPAADGDQNTATGGNTNVVVGDDPGLPMVSEGLENFLEPEGEPEMPEPPAMLGSEKGPLEVNVMPGKYVGKGEPYAWPNQNLVIWGNVKNGTPPYTYEWDFGDGSPVATGSVSNVKYIAENYAYTTLGTKRAVLTVTDADSDVDMDTVIIEVVPYSLEVDVNLAIEEGLRYLYLHQTSSGGWSYSYPVAATAQAVLCFENNGHLPTNNYNEDIYAEFVKAGLDYVTNYLTYTSVPNQPYCNPEADAEGNTDNNGIGLYRNNSRPTYTIGMILMALVGSGAPDMVAPNGNATWVQGRTYYDIVVDIVDYCAWAQNEHSVWRGGWRYYPNYGSSDNSVSQWPAIGMEAAETWWGISPPECVKTENERWVNYSQLSDGRFYYTNYWPYNFPAVTGAGMCQMAFDGIPTSDPRWPISECYIRNHWNTSRHLGWPYAMYAIAKACRIAKPEPVELLCGDFDWYEAYVQDLLPRQYGDGHFQMPAWGIMDHEWSVLVLQQLLPGPVAVITSDDIVFTGQPFTLDGSESYHIDSDNHEITDWHWDFFGSDGQDYDVDPDTIGEVVEHPGYTLPEGVAEDTITVGLKVYDDSDPTRTDATTKQIIVTRGCVPPVAVCGGPYAGKVGQTINLDGSGSYVVSSDECPNEIVLYEWDLDGDGQFDDAVGPTAEYFCDQSHEGQIGLRVTDSYGDTDVDYTDIDCAEVDLDLQPGAISFDTNPDCDTVEIFGEIFFNAEYDTTVYNVRVRFFDGDPADSVNPIGDPIIIPVMDSGDVVTVSVIWEVPDPEDDACHQIFVQVDPRGELSEYNENNNALSEPWCCAVCEGQCYILPAVQYAYMINAVVPFTWIGCTEADQEFEDCMDNWYYRDTLIIDPRRAPLYIGAFDEFYDGAYDAFDVDQSTLMINGVLVPESSWVADVPHDYSVPIFQGEPVLCLRYNLGLFILTYANEDQQIWDADTVRYDITGSFTDGSPFEACGMLPLIGHTSGDVNSDGNINVSDLTNLVAYLFRGSVAPDPLYPADVDHDGRVNVADVSTLVGLLFME